MSVEPSQAPAQNVPAGMTMRKRILITVISVIVLAVAGSTFSLIQVAQFQKELGHINEVAIPLGRLTMQLKNDAEIYLRESERRLGQARWSEPGWRPTRVARWLEDVIDHESARLLEVTRQADPKWQTWALEVSKGFESVRKSGERLAVALSDQRLEEAQTIYVHWTREMEVWSRIIKTGAVEAEQQIRKGFFTAQTQALDLKAGLQAVLVVVMVFSLALLWFGERALRPMQVLTDLAKNIRVRGTFTKNDKQLMAALDPGRTDEVSQFAREFHRLATTLLEREKTVELQQARLQDQNQLLRRMLDEQRELQQKLQIAEHLAAVGRMSAQVAHEVRNPLHSMGLEAELALEHATDSAQRESIGSIMKGIERLELMTENYLKLSRLSAGKKIPIDCEEVLHRVIETYRPQAERAGIEVELDHSSQRPCRVYGDPEVLEQAFGNLMRNAIQALLHPDGQASSEHKPRIEWTFGHAESGRVWVRIRDTGPGIQEEHRSKLFQPFFTTKAQGTGLGLSFVKKVFENHGGDIQLLTESSGRTSGTVFEMVLPAITEPKTLEVENVEASHRG